MSILFVQFIWFSFILIGLAVTLICRNYIPKQYHQIHKLVTLTNQAPLTISLLFTLIIGLVSLSPVVIASYFLNLPTVILLIFYLGAILVSLIVIYRNKALLKKTWQKRFVFTMRQLAISILVFAPLIFDYVMSLKVGAPLFGDAPVQIAKIHFFITNHITLSDPYFNQNGVIDPRYSTNLLNAYQALIAKLIGLTAVKVWLYSYGFYRLLLWLSLYALTWSFLPKKYKSLSYIVLALSPILFAQLFIYANLPDRIVFAWICIFIIGLKRWFEHNEYVLLIIGSLLIATTHALFSLMGLSFMFLLAIALTIFRQIKLKDLYALGINALILFVPVAINLYYPNHTNQDPTAFNPGLAPPPLHSYWILHISSLPSLNLLLCALYLTLFAILLLAEKVSSSAVKWSVYCLTLIILLIWFSYAYLAILGYGLLLYISKSTKVKIMVGCLILLYPVIIYNPIFWHIDNHHVPPWVIFRFSYFNVLALLAPVFGLAVFTFAPIYRWHKYTYPLYGLATVASLVIIGYAIQNLSLPYGYISWHTVQQDDADRLKSLATIQSFSSELNNHVVFSNDQTLSMITPDVMTANVVSFLPQNETPMTNILARANCRNALIKSLGKNNIGASKMTAILADGTYPSVVYSQIRYNPEIHFVAKSNKVYLFSVQQKLTLISNKNICSFPSGQ